MAAYSTLISYIQSIVRANGNEEITGPNMQSVLLALVNIVGVRQFRGVANPATNPGIVEGQAVYITAQDGNYTHFGGIDISDEIALLIWTGTEWIKDSVIALHKRAHQVDSILDHPAVPADKRDKWMHSDPVTGEIKMDDLPASLLDVYVEDLIVYGDFIEDLFKVDGAGTTQITSIQKPRGLIYGGQVTWVDGLQFIASSALYFLGGSPIIALDAMFTLDPAHLTLDRIDIIVANEAGEFVVKPGTPSAAPIAPYVNPVSEILISTILLPAGTISFGSIFAQNIIYNENEEWVGTASGCTVDLDNLTSPYLGSKCALLGALDNGDYLKFVSPTKIAVTDYDIFSIALKLNIVWNKSQYVLLQFFYQGAAQTAPLKLQIMNNYVDYWFLCIVRFSEIKSTGWTQFDEVRIIFDLISGVPSGIYIDYIKLEKSFSPPPSSTTILLDGDITGAGNVGGPAIQTTLKTVTTAGTFGAATKVPQIVVDKNGRILSVTEKTITGVAGDSAYLYIGYASDDTGTDFSLDYDSPSMLPRKYIAALSTATEIITPLAADFAGLWVKFVGDDGDPGDLTHYTYVAWRDSPGAGFTLTPNINLEFEAILVTHTQLTPPVEADFNGLWRQRLTPTTIPPTEDVILPKTLTGARGIKSKFTANEAQVFGDACFINAVGKMQLGKATGITSSSAVGMCINTSIAANVEGDYLLQGFAQEVSWDWDTGGLLYLTIAGTAGNTISQESPFNSIPLVEDNVVQILGVAKSENTIYFNPSLSQVIIKA